LDTDVTLELIELGIKENIILKSERSPKEFTFLLKGVDGSDNLSSFSNQIKVIPSWYSDVNGNKRVAKQSLRHEGEEYFLDITVETDGLEYPITIDPTVTTSSNLVTGEYIDFTVPSDHIIVPGHTSVTVQPIATRILHHVNFTGTNKGINFYTDDFNLANQQTEGDYSYMYIYVGSHFCDLVQTSGPRFIQVTLNSNNSTCEIKVDYWIWSTKTIAFNSTDIVSVDLNAEEMCTNLYTPAFSLNNHTYSYPNYYLEPNNQWIQNIDNGVLQSGSNRLKHLDSSYGYAKFTIEYGYKKRGAQYVYDKNGRLDYIDINEETRLNYQYDANGNLTKIEKTLIP